MSGQTRVARHACSGAKAELMCHTGWQMLPSNSRESWSRICQLPSQPQQGQTCRLACSLASVPLGRAVSRFCTGMVALGFMGG